MDFLTAYRMNSLLSIKTQWLWKKIPIKHRHPKIPNQLYQENQHAFFYLWDIENTYTCSFSHKSSYTAFKRYIYKSTIFSHLIKYINLHLNSILSFWLHVIHNIKTTFYDSFFFHNVHIFICIWQINVIFRKIFAIFWLEWKQDCRLQSAHDQLYVYWWPKYLLTKQNNQKN